MAASVKLPGEALTVSCQLYSSVQGPRNPSSLSLNPSITLPEVDCNYQSHRRNSSSNNEVKNTNHAVENTRRHKSSQTSQLNLYQSRDTPQLQKDLFPESEGNDNERDDYLDGDDLNNYEDSSFELHGTSNITQNRALQNTTKPRIFNSNHCSGSSPVCNLKAKMMHQDMYLYGNSKEDDQVRSLLDSGPQHCRDNNSTRILMDFEEQENEDEEDYNENVSKAFSDCESSTQNQTDYVSDSSRKSSEGVLDNFTAIQSIANNAVFSMLADLDSPAKKSHWPASMSQDDDVKPILCLSPCGVDPNCNNHPLDFDPLSLEIPNGIARLQSQNHLMTSAQNYYKLVACDLSPLSFPSPVSSSLNMAHSRGRVTPPGEYYLFKQPEEERRVLEEDLQGDGNTQPNRVQTVIKNLPKGAREKKSHNETWHQNSQDPELNSQEHTAQPQSRVEVKECQNSPNQEAQLHVARHPMQTDINLSSCEPRSLSHTDTDVSSHDSKQQVTSFVTLACSRMGDKDSLLVKNSVNTKSTSRSERTVQLGPNVTAISNHTAKMSPNSATSVICSTPSTFEGPCASSPEVIRYTKAQRPTSLPIQPFILQPPSGQQHKKDLGSLLSQYISHLHEKTGTSKNTGKCTQLAGHLGASPLGNYYSIHLESSSDVCSTCSLSPVQSHFSPHWVQTHTHHESDHKTLEPKVSSLQIPHELGEEILTSRPGSQEECELSLHSPCPAIPSWTSLTSEMSLISVSGAGRRPPWPPDAAFWAQISLLKTVSSAVDLITAHFSSYRDLEEKIRLGNSLLCPSISKLVLGQLCPAIRNILQDGLKAFKHDLVVGQQHNKPWSVVEASSQPGPSTRVLHSLVSVVRKCSQLTSHNLRLNAFFLGLLNLRALEAWFHHLHTCAGVVTEYYHPWAFLTLSQGPACGSLFQELLLLLQPLSHLPFDLHLLSELRLQSRPEQRPIPTSGPLPLSACTFLQISPNPRRVSSPERPREKEENALHTLAQAESHAACSTHMTKKLTGCVGRFCKLPKLLSAGQRQNSVSPVCSRRERAGWWLAEMDICSHSPPQAGGVELIVENRESRTGRVSATSPGSKATGELYWAWLFGSGISTPVAMDSTQKRSMPTKRSRLPSQWLKMGASKVELLVQSVWAGKTDRLWNKRTIRPQPQLHS
ncbi:iporin [Electrophorus electricus]|uniref:iporin n=1 Tax=Electrophorus electricus TaxID=8005 RepID=UPI0015CFCB70|nr:iporin [Electrophorus electricus]